MVLKPVKRGTHTAGEKSDTTAEAKPTATNGSTESQWRLDPTAIRYAFLSLGIWISFTVFGYCQESLTRQEFNGRRFVWTEALIVCQCISNVIVSGTVICFSRSPTTASNEEKSLKPVNKWTANVPVRDWFVVALGYLGAHSFGLAALKHIIFPLQVIIKSCKSIPVMIGEIVIAHHPPSLAKTINVIQLSGGVALFMYAKAASSSAGKGLTWDSEMLFGASLACMALVCDAIYGPYQNKICKKHNPSNWVLMFNMNFFELVVALGMAIYNNEIVPAFKFVMEDPYEVGSRLALYCMTMSLGNVFIFLMQKEFGALAVAKTTTVRKLVSVVLSVLMFGHRILPVQWLAILIVFTAPMTEKRINELRKPTAVKSKSAKKRD